MQTVGVFHEKTAAEHALDALRQVGMKNTRLAYQHYADTGLSPRAGTGALTGALVGALIGALAGLAVAYNILPGLAGLIVAGPLAVTLGFAGAAATTIAGAITGLVVGAIIGVIAGLALSTGVPTAAESDENEIVLTAQTEDPLQAKRIMREYGADDVRTYDK